MTPNAQKKEIKPGKIFALIIFLLFLTNGLILPVLLIFGLIYLPLWLAKKKSENAHKSITQPVQQSIGSKNTTAFDDCPQSPICFHKDKGEHHLARGKEIDPWDRPDIDISKYQRKR